MYDIKSGIRKPVLNMSYGENPITSLVCLPDDSKYNFYILFFFNLTCQINCL